VTVNVIAADAHRTPAIMNSMTARDEVDRIVEAWRRERPELDVEPLQVLSRVSRLARHLDLARKQAFTASGLESWEFDVLSALRRAGQPYELSPKALLQQTLVSSGTMTNRIDRLTTRGLVERRTDPKDGRGIRVCMTDDGRVRVDGAIDQLMVNEATLLRRLSSADQERLAGLLRTLSADFDDVAPVDHSQDRPPSTQQPQQPQPQPQPALKQRQDARQQNGNDADAGENAAESE